MTPDDKSDEPASDGISAVIASVLVALPPSKLSLSLLPAFLAATGCMASSARAPHKNPPPTTPLGWVILGLRVLSNYIHTQRRGRAAVGDLLEMNAPAVGDFVLGIAPSSTT